MNGRSKIGEYSKAAFHVLAKRAGFLIIFGIAITSIHALINNFVPARLLVYKTKTAQMIKIDKTYTDLKGNVLKTLPESGIIYERKCTGKDGAFKEHMDMCAYFPVNAEILREELAKQNKSSEYFLHTRTILLVLLTLFVFSSIFVILSGKETIRNLIPTYLRMLATLSVAAVSIPAGLLRGPTCAVRRFFVYQLVVPEIIYTSKYCRPVLNRLEERFRKSWIDYAWQVIVLVFITNIIRIALEFVIYSADQSGLISIAFRLIYILISYVIVAFLCAYIYSFYENDKITSHPVGGYH